ncbi:hypothetical protein G6F40_014694 [Rhizopus arrhizus]|nr:hypothetical protein G6F40_014694 [Rhizopus arrhizus]
MEDHLREHVLAAAPDADRQQGGEELVEVMRSYLKPSPQRTQGVAGHRVDSQHDAGGNHRRDALRIDGAGGRRLAYVHACGRHADCGAGLRIRPSPCARCPFQFRHGQAGRPGGLRQRHRAGDGVATDRLGKRGQAGQPRRHPIRRGHRHRSRWTGREPRQRMAAERRHGPSPSHARRRTSA